MWRICRICELIAKIGSAHVSWSVRVARTAHEKRRIFLSWDIRSQARERVPLGEQTRTDLRGPKANRVVVSELWDFIFHTFAGTDRENLQGVSHKQERRVFCGRSISHTFMCYGRFNEPRLSGVTCTCTQYACPLINHNSYSIPLAAG